MEGSKAILQTSVTLQFSLEGFEKQLLSFEDEGEAQILLDYDQICKRILHSCKYIASGRRNIRLIVSNFYGKSRQVQIPIFNHKNWTTLVADMLQRQIYTIHVKVIKQGELRQKKKRLKNTPVEFDSDGSIQSAEDNKIKEAIVKNKPQDEPYRGSDVIRCIFCNLTNRQTKGKRQAGSFYGPFKGNVYAHLLCLLWCSYVYLNESGFLCEVNKGIKESKTMKCMYCKLKGASFCCHSRSCRKQAHYRCATINNWFFNWGDFTVYCPEQQIYDPIQPESQTLGTTRTLTMKENRQILEKMDVEYPQEQMKNQESDDM